MTQQAVAPRLEVDQMMERLSNWGRWGKEDQRGALNLITAGKRARAAGLVEEGHAVSLARDAVKTPMDDSPPFEHTMVETGLNCDISSSDIYSVRYHGFTVTHLDALCHVFYRGRMYNGYSQREVSEAGAGKLSVIQAKEGIFTRGVLMDFPRLLGTPYLEGGTGIRPAELDRWERETGITVSSGDAVVIRTGRWARRAVEGPWAILRDSAGLHYSCMPWLRERDIAVLASDLAADAMPGGVEGVLLPVHAIAIVAMGVHILDNCDLEELGRATASRQRHDFLLTAAPLAVEGGTGSPVNPTAVF